MPKRRAHRSFNRKIIDMFWPASCCIAYCNCIDRKSSRLMTEQKVLKEKIERRFEALSDTWFQNELMEPTKHYLSRGRRFELLAAAQLNQEGATAFRRYVRFRVGLYVLNMADAWA